MEEKYFIKLIETREGKYFYDVNRNCIIQIDCGLFNVLQKNQSMTTEARKDIDLYKKNGLLSNKKMTQILHPMNFSLEDMLDRKLSTIALQITQACNLRCAYCPYTAPDKNRGRIHSNKNMTFDTAKKAIDYLYDHSIDSDYIAIAFYGGEPLLQYSLIKDCVEYSKKLFKGKYIVFHITTNGTLLSDEIVKFLNKNNFNVMISIDGEKRIHDKNRKFVNGCGSYDIIISNLLKIQKKYPSFFKKIIFNTVMDMDNNFSCSDSLYRNNNVFKGAMTNFSIMNQSHKKEKKEPSTSFSYSYNYEYFKFLLFLINKLDEKDISPLLYNSAVQNIQNFRKMGQTYSELSNVFHPSGPCIPGVKKTFVDINGNFFPCEKLNETIEDLNIGNVTDGYDIEKIRKILNIGKYTENECKNCWGSRYCKICIQKMQGNGKLSVEEKKKYCKLMLDNLEKLMKEYIILRKCGFDADKKYFDLLQ